MASIGWGLKYHPVPTPPHGLGCLPLGQFLGKHLLKFSNKVILLYSFSVLKPNSVIGKANYQVF